MPDYEEGLLFYDIEFFYFKSNTFLYPETCLTSGPLKIFPPTTDPVSIIYKFTGDVKGRVIKLCGQQLNICPEVRQQLHISSYIIFIFTFIKLLISIKFFLKILNSF